MHANEEVASASLLDQYEREKEVSDEVPPEDSPHPRGHIPVPQWNDYYDWPPPGGMRHLIFNAKTNGFEAAFKRVGRRVLVDPERFWKIVNGGGET